MESKITVGVAGCGYWGPNLIRNFRSLRECRVKAICDKSQERLAHMESLYPEVETLSDFEAMVHDPEIDAIAVATPVSTHFSLASQCLSNGKHTFIEKPMAANSEQCRELNELAKAKGLRLMVGHTFIYTSVVRKIKQIIEAGDLGEILYISSRRLNLGLFQKDINVAWDLAPHDISIILYLLGETPVSVNCQGKAHVTKGIEDVTNISLTFSNGRFATIQSSWLDPKKIREMTIVGSKRMLVYDDLEPLEKVKIYDKRVEGPSHYDTFAEFHYSYHYGDMYSPHIEQIEPLKVECEHFLDCIRNGKTPESNGQEGLKVVQILEASSRSLGEGGSPVHLNGHMSGGS
jgi:predicted dehydrogenase